jgi:hypothetical protein
VATSLPERFHHHRHALADPSKLANPISLPVTPPNVTGIYGAQVVAVDAASGAVIAGTIGGWSCTAAGPTQFDGGYNIPKLPVGHSYTIYAELLDGAVDPSQIGNAMQTLAATPPLTRAGHLNSVALFPR